MVDLQLKVSNIKVTQGVIERDLTTLLSQAKEVQEHLETITVTPETVQASKKLIATINKKRDLLETRRKEIKKQLLEPYYEFEKEVKEIMQVINDANSLVKSQVDDLEEQRRDEKYEKIQTLWEMVSGAYPFDFVKFDNFFETRYLNKSLSMTKIEEEMTSFLERILSEVNTISKLNESDAILVWYIKTLNLDEALKQHTEHSQVASSVKPIDDDDLVIEPTLRLVIKGKKDIELVVNYLKTMDISHEIIK